MSAAISSSDKGHTVELYEKENCLGGQLNIAVKPLGREEFAVLAEDLDRQVHKRNIAVFLDIKIDINYIKKRKLDQVIIVTGRLPVISEIPGVNLTHVVNAWDVLTKKNYTGKKVSIAGGGAVGVETALFLPEKGTLSGDIIKFLLVNKSESPEDLYIFSTRGSKKIL